MNKTIKELSETELKAVAYDNLAQIEQCQNNLKVINDELKNRSQEAITNSEEIKDEDK